MYNINMSEITCNQCGECCKRILVDFDQKILFRDGIEPLDENFSKMLIPIEKKENITFCYCKFLQENLCTNTCKPDICQKFPSSPFAFLPENCAYYGEIFLKNESIKQKIRKMKEEILHYEALISKTTSKSETKQYQKIINSHKIFISRFKPYGSDNW
jgi:hypothetical protein